MICSFSKKLNNLEIDSTLKWVKAEITQINENFLILKSKQNENIKIQRSNLKWALRDKNIFEVFEIFFA